MDFATMSWQEVQGHLFQHGWRPMETAPRDGTPIVAYVAHESDAYVEDTKSGKLTTYGAHAEGVSHAADGFHVLVWGGEYTEDYDYYSGGFTIPDWWFIDEESMETVAAPIAWKPLAD